MRDLISIAKRCRIVLAIVPLLLAIATLLVLAKRGSSIANEYQVEISYVIDVAPPNADDVMADEINASDDSLLALQSESLLGLLENSSLYDEVLASLQLMPEDYPLSALQAGRVVTVTIDGSDTKQLDSIAEAISARVLSDARDLLGISSIHITTPYVTAVDALSKEAAFSIPRAGVFLYVAFFAATYLCCYLYCAFGSRLVTKISKLSRVDSNSGEIGELSGDGFDDEQAHELVLIANEMLARIPYKCSVAFLMLGSEIDGAIRGLLDVIGLIGDAGYEVVASVVGGRFDRECQIYIDEHENVEYIGEDCDEGDGSPNVSNDLSFLVRKEFRCDFLEHSQTCDYTFLVVGPDASSFDRRMAVRLCDECIIVIDERDSGGEDYSALRALVEDAGKRTVGFIGVSPE